MRGGVVLAPPFGRVRVASEESVRHKISRMRRRASGGEVVETGGLATAFGEEDPIRGGWKNCEISRCHKEKSFSEFAKRYDARSARPFLKFCIISIGADIGMFR